MITPVLIIALVLLLSSTFGYTILKPAALAAAQSDRRSSAFQVVDLFSLPVLLAIPFTFYASVRSTFFRDTLWIADVLGVLLASVFGYIWWRAATTLSQGGVSQGMRRAIYIGILVPVAVVGSAIGVPWLLATTTTLDQFSPTVQLVWLLWGCSVVPLAQLGRKASQWVFSQPIRHASVGPPRDTC